MVNEKLCELKALPLHQIQIWKGTLSNKSAKSSNESQTHYTSFETGMNVHTIATTLEEGKPTARRARLQPVTGETSRGIMEGGKTAAILGDQISS